MKARSIFGSRYSTRTIDRAAFPGHTASLTVTTSPKRPTRLSAKSRRGVPRVVAPPILATAKAPYLTSRESTSFRRLSSRRWGVIPRPEEVWWRPRALAMRCRLLRCSRHECRLRTSNRLEAGNKLQESPSIRSAVPRNSSPEPALRKSVMKASSRPRRGSCKEYSPNSMGDVRFGSKAEKLTPTKCCPLLPR